MSEQVSSSENLSGAAGGGNNNTTYPRVAQQVQNEQSSEVKDKRQSKVQEMFLKVKSWN